MKTDKNRINIFILFNVINVVLIVAALVSATFFAITTVQATHEPTKYTKWKDLFGFLTILCAGLVTLSTLLAGICVFVLKWQTEWARKHKIGYGILILLFSLVLLGIIAIIIFTVNAKSDFRYRPNQEVIIPVSKNKKEQKKQQQDLMNQQQLMYNQMQMQYLHQQQYLQQANQFQNNIIIQTEQQNINLQNQIDPQPFVQNNNNNTTN